VFLKVSTLAGAIHEPARAARKLIEVTNMQEYSNTADMPLMDGQQYVDRTEEELEQVGVDAGMADSRAFVSWDHTYLQCEDTDGYQHNFTFATPELEW
jgi:hypothetical protein